MHWEFKEETKVRYEIRGNQSTCMKFKAMRLGETAKRERVGRKRTSLTLTSDLLQCLRLGAMNKNHKRSPAAAAREVGGKLDKYEVLPAR